MDSKLKSVAHRLIQRPPVHAMASTVRPSLRYWPNVYDRLARNSTLAVGRVLFRKVTQKTALRKLDSVQPTKISLLVARWRASPKTSGEVHKSIGQNRRFRFISLFVKYTLKKKSKKENGSLNKDGHYHF